MPTLHDQIESEVNKAAQRIAAAIAPGIIEALRNSTLDQINQFISGTAPKAAGTPGPKPGTKPTTAPSGRLARRSEEDIKKAVLAITGLLSRHPEGLGAEGIRAALRMDKREIGRPIEVGLADGRITKKGQRRATKYFLGGAGKIAGKKKASSATKKASRRKG